MLSRRWPLLVPGVLLGLVSLLGCRQAMTVSEDEAVAPPEEPKPVVVTRAKAEPVKEVKAEPVKEVPADKEGFHFPDDQCGALLVRVLTPDLDRSLLTERTSGPRRSPLPPSLEAPTLPLSSAPVELPRVGPRLKRAELRPRLVFEETLGQQVALAAPQVPALATGEKIRLPSADVKLPPPLPLLTPQPTPDRASLEDATAEASATAAVAAQSPLRSKPVPFLRLSIPDPYENRSIIRLNDTLPESLEVPVIIPRTPK